MKTVITYMSLLCFTMLMACNATEQDQKIETPESKAKTKTEIIEAEKQKTIVFFGTSLSKGLGVDLEECFAGLIEKRIDSLDLPYRVVNAGVSGETTAGAESRIDWILKQPLDILVLESGANDGLRGIDSESSYKNLQSIIDKTKAKYPNVKLIIAGMMAPPNMGEEFTTKFRAMFPKIAKENDALLIPFLLEGVAGIPSLNQKDGIHPTPAGHKIIMENIWTILKGIL